MMVYMGIINTSDGSKVLEVAFPHLLCAQEGKAAEGPPAVE